MAETGCSTFCDWLIRQIWKLGRLRSRALREAEEELESETDFINDEMYSDLRLLLNGEYSIDPTTETKKVLCFVKKITKSIQLEKSNWQLLSKRYYDRHGVICATFPISTANYNNYYYRQNLKNTFECKSFITVNASLVDRSVRVYQNPIACPTSPIRRLRTIRPYSSNNGAPICGQLSRGSSKIFIHWGCCSDVDVKISGIRIDRILIFDLNRKFSAIHFSIEVPVESLLYFCFADTNTTTSGDRLRLIYFNFKHYKYFGESAAIVYECPIRDGEHFPQIRQVDGKKWSDFPSFRTRRSLCFYLSKSFDDEYFIWFLLNANDSEELKNLFCLTYERDEDDDKIWKWSPDLIPFNEWAESKWGRRLMREVEMLKKIRPDSNEIDLVRVVELKYREGVVFARTKPGYLRRYAFHPPSLQSMSIDLVRRMIEEETVDTKSLEKLNWWRKLIGAAGLFDLCPHDYGDEELNIDEL